MKPIEQLFNAKFVKQYLEKHTQEFVKKHDISDLSIKSIKKNIGGTFYHIVVKFNAKSFNNTSLFCTAHADEDRSIPYKALSFINKHGFKGKNVFLPKPLFFDTELKAFCYQGTSGENLLHYIKEPKTDLTKYIKQAAHWISELHSIPVTNKQNFNPKNGHIKSVVPGPKYFLAKIKRLYPEMFKSVNFHFNNLVKIEEKNFKTIGNKSLIHGDFHPENVIINKSDKNVSVIDFTDLCLGDWARDVGAFVQQLRYMSRAKRSDKQTRKHQQIFINEYLKTRNIKKSNTIEKRITLYRAWAALRSSIFFLTKEPAEPKNAQTELDMVTELTKKL